MTNQTVSIPAWLSSETDQRRLLHLILDMGELMLDSGAEINRVEDTLSRVGHAYGAQMNVFVIIYSIVITMTFPGGAERTLTRRVLNPVQINFKRLERLNDLSRRCCAQPMDLETLATELEIVRGERFGSRRAFIGNMLGAFSFAVFFGGSIADGLASAGFAVLVVLLDKAVGQSVFRNMAVWFYVANEGLSILENLALAGVPFPESIKQALEQMREKNDHVQPESDEQKN